MLFLVYYLSCELGVPVIAWNGDDLRVDYQTEGIPDDVYAQANVQTAEEAADCVARIGCPVMIKASEGGGGKGIRKVLNPAEVPSMFRQVQSEVPGSPIFVMKMASKARHLEVQLLADKYGEAIALSGRDCSVQRRHQKIIEEGPPTAAPAAVFRKMERAAVALAKTVGYCNAGTVEYLFMEGDHSFAFLELNPRLQVEHPVTENILGLNLPACQLQVAMGLPLHRISDIRKLYGRHPMGSDTIDFEYSERCAPPRHCIAVRVTAENPEAAFQPTSGQIEELQFRSSVDVWGYFSVDNNSRVHEFADSQFGHIFAGGKDREAARRSMIVALKELTIRGEIRTTVEYIIKLLQSEDFVNNKLDTTWLDGRIERHVEISAVENGKYCPAAQLVALCGAALQGYRHFVRRGTEFTDMLKVGQVPSKYTLLHSVNIDLIYDNTKYKTNVIQSNNNEVIVECNTHREKVEIRPLSDGGYLVNTAGHSNVVYLKNETGGVLRCIVNGTTCLFTPEYDPTKLKSSVAGKFARQLVPDGSHLEAGDAYVEIEVMKMYMPLRAQEAGTVHFQLSEGATLNPGDIIAVMRLDRPDKVVKADEFQGHLKAKQALRLSNISVSSANDDEDVGEVPPNIVMREAWRRLESVLDGFFATDAEINTAMDIFLENFDDKMVAALELDEAKAVLRGRLDPSLSNALNSLNDNFKMAMFSSAQSGQATPLPPSGGHGHGLHTPTVGPDFPAVQLLHALHEHALSIPQLDRRNAFVAQTSTVWSTIEKYLYPVEVRKVAALQTLIEKYLAVEKLFDNLSFTDVVSDLRKQYNSDLTRVLNLCRSTVNLNAKNALMMRVMDELKKLSFAASVPRPVVPIGLPIRHEVNTRNLKLRLKDVSKLRQQDYIHVSFSANLVLMSQNTLKADARRQKFHDAITSALSTGEGVGEGERMAILKKFVETNVIIRDLILDALRHDPEYQIAGMEMYLMKIYGATHHLKGFTAGASLGSDNSDASPWVKFVFMTKKVTSASPNTNTVNELSSNLLGSSSVDELDGTPGRRPMQILHAPANSILSPLTPTINDRPVEGPIQGVRQGILAAFEHTSEMFRLFPALIAKISSAHATKYGVVNAVHVLLAHADLQPSAVAAAMGSPGAIVYNDDEMSNFLSQFLKTQLELLRSKGIRRVTFFVGHPVNPSSAPKHSHTNLAALVGTSHAGAHQPQQQVGGQSIFTFRHSSDFCEDRLFRHIEAPHAFHLDLPRLSHFTVSLESNPVTSGGVFLYRAVPKDGSNGGQHRFFVRLVSFTSSDMHTSETEALFVEALDHLGLNNGSDESNKQSNPNKAVQNVSYAANHVFLNVVAPDNVASLAFYEKELHRICTKYWFKVSRAWPKD
jgi:acetyl-CoA carboxylase/biotin carboxylase 1